jgi:murein DD-endopeptidase MepM/ murein hydrolase activator NlpD
LRWIDPFGLVTWPTGYQYVPPQGEFRAPRPGGRLHKGLDIRNPIGDPVYASDSGTVIGVWYAPLGGNQILILHDDGSISGYAHTGSIVVVGQ